MAIKIGHPGVYIEEIRKFPPSVAAVETAIPAFIGYTKIAKDKAREETEHDLILVPKRITSLFEYERYFGTSANEEKITGKVVGDQLLVTIETPSPHNMYYAMQSYFANGGGPCWVISVGLMTIPTAPGSVKKDDLENGIAEAEKVDEVTLLVFPESLALVAYPDTGPNLSEYAGVMDSALASCKKLGDRFTVMDVPPNVEIATFPPPATTDKQDIVQTATNFRNTGVGINNLIYGAAYTPQIETVFNYLFEEKDVKVTLADGTTEVNLEELNPAVGIDDGSGNIIPNPKSDAPIYALTQQAIDFLPVVLPPSPMIVGIYAAVDSTRGVWKAPANVSLQSVVGPTLPISEEQQDDLNITATGKSINAIRTFTGKGHLVWGARTLAGNDNEWRYINVRRFFNFVEESVKKASEPFVFEPNDRNTWTRVRGMIENFLLIQWRNGALAGAVPEDAFFVQVGLPETMTSLDILEGRMNVEIGMAVVRPAEFIILNFSHLMQVS